MRIPLDRQFRYVHEPLSQNHPLPLLEREQEIARLKERFLNSSGGSFLVTGFRGVGKTTVVNRMLEEASDGSDALQRVIPVRLNLARSLETTSLMFEIIRRLFEALHDEGVLDELPADLVEIIQAYSRTSQSFKRTSTQTTEASTSASLGSDKTVKLSLLSSRKKINALAIEASFLAYTESDVEHDLLRIIQRLQKGWSPPQFWGRLGNLAWRFLQWSRITDRSPSLVTPRFLFVFDEIDKLTATEDGLTILESLISDMKNILCTPGVCFIFIGGVDLHDRYFEDVRKGNSLYESVFAWHLYIPCAWASVRRLIEFLADGPVRDEIGPLLCDYLKFKGRGVFRKLIQELNAFVVWENDIPYLDLARDQERVKFYAAIQGILMEFLEEVIPKDDFPLQIDQDRSQLATYYLTDWILASGGNTFTALQICQEALVDPAIPLGYPQVALLLHRLVKSGIVEEAGIQRTSSRPGDHTVIDDIQAPQEKLYRLAKDAHEHLARFSRVSAMERAKPVPVLDADEKRNAIFRQLLGSQQVKEIQSRYEFSEEFGLSGIFISYRARDSLTSREVLIKALSPPLMNDPIAVTRFQRQARIGAALSHPNIVKILNAYNGLNQEGPVVIASEFVSGTKLDGLQLNAEKAVAVALQICDALEYASARGMCRLNIKPASVVVRENDTVVLTDLGVIKQWEASGAFLEAESSATLTGARIGTPRYMSPETSPRRGCRHPFGHFFTGRHAL